MTTVTIEVSASISDLPQRSSQKIKRMAQILKDEGLNIELTWKDSVKETLVKTNNHYPRVITSYFR